MKSLWRYGLFALLVYGLFLVALLPAPWAYAWMKDRLPRGMALYGPEGTLWQGHAAAARIDGVVVQDVAWDMHPLALFLGHLETALSFKGAAGPGAVVVGRGFGQWYLRDAKLELPVRSIAPLVRRAGLQLGGRLDLNLSRLALAQGRIREAEGTLTWRNAALEQPVELDLGGFQARLETHNDEVRGQIRDQDGPIETQGVFLLSPDGSYRFTGTLAARDSQRTDLVQGLRFLGQPGPDGRVSVSYSGSLPPLGNLAGK